MGRYPLVTFLVFVLAAAGCQQPRRTDRAPAAGTVERTVTVGLRPGQGLDYVADLALLLLATNLFNLLDLRPGRVEKGDRVPMDLKVGDNVIYGKYSGTPFQLGGDEVIIIKASDVLAKIS